jgi:nickel-dependent lactate racemase
VGTVLEVPQLAWHGANGFKLDFPDGWNVRTVNMEGYDRPALLPGQIRAAIRFPLGSKPIHELARGKKQVVIIFDDIQRATRCAEIVPFIIEELQEAGISDRQIRFIGACGLHGVMNRSDFAKKLGEEIVSRYPVYNHNAFSCCQEAGTTSLGTKLLVNAEVLQCDFKIAVGSTAPHSFAGFSGGAKIILPGICHYDTVVQFHTMGSKFKKEHPEIKIGTGVIENNPLRADMEEAASLVGLDFKIDTLINGWGDISAVYAGSLKEAYARAVQDAANHYNSPLCRDRDIVIANTYAKAAECESGLEIAYGAVKATGGEVVLIGNTPDGHVSHYLAGPWGQTNISALQMQVKIPDKVRRLIILNTYPDRTILGYFADREKITLAASWEETLALLKKGYPAGADVAVYPNSETQYCSEQEIASTLSFENKKS